MLELTLDYPRPPQPSGRGGAVSFELEPVQLVGMRALAAGCGATLFMALLAVWQVTCGPPHDVVLLYNSTRLSLQTWQCAACSTVHATLVLALASHMCRDVAPCSRREVPHETPNRS